MNRHGANADQNLAELWQRIVFNICVSNTDDHLRNHGFLLTHQGWELSPAYDMNPVESATGLRLNISETDNALDLDLALKVIPYFRLKEKKARQIIAKVLDAVKGWRGLAKKFNIRASELDMMQSAFKLVDWGG